MPEAVYLVHGLLGTAYGHFGAQISAWRERYRVVPVDLPGHGGCRLDAGERYYDEALRYLTATVDRFGPGHLIGASYLGGPLAYRCAAQRPDAIRTLVLTGFVPGIEREVFLELAGGFGRLAAEHPPLAAEYERLHTVRWKETLHAVTGHADAAFESTALVRPEELAALDTRTLLLNGTVKSAERAAAERAHTYGGRLRGQLVEGAGHLVGHDRPEEFNRAVEEFWRDRREED